jgi:anthranilate synthase/aminodeoxychorismate synthase-like glutamine amidotransferase
MIVLIDNYDSFTYNIYHYILHFTEDISVVRNTQKMDELKNIKNLDAIVLSPGPSHPSNSYLTLDAIDYFKAKLPIFGVCLGMQAIGYYFGADIRKAKNVMHGKVDKIEHTASAIFKSMDEKLSVVRYHSLVIDNPKELAITAKSLTDNEIMAIEKADMAIYGVQFHPESLLSQNGIDVIKNFLGVVYD